MRRARPGGHAQTPKQVAEQLADSEDPHSRDAIQAAINSVTNERPSDSDINRVRAYLAAGGWPLARPDEMT